VKSVIHLMPYDGIGGVEMAAKSIDDGLYDDINFSSQFIFDEVKVYKFKSKTLLPWPIFKSIRRILKRRPDILILSLWRSCAVGILVKLLRPKQRLILMLHDTRDAHLLDKVTTRLAARMSDELWADSAETFRQRLARDPGKPMRVISFLIRDAGEATDLLPKPRFLFWGRISPQKDVGRAVRLFSDIYAVNKDAQFFVIGPDGGELESVTRLVNQLGLDGAVKFLGPMTFDLIAREASMASFYLQTSVHEGMAMAVVEAMQLGLVPVVTPVGEIARYCRAGENAIILDETGSAVGEILAMLDDPDQFQTLRKNAATTWRDVPRYRESMLDACRGALAS